MIEVLKQMVEALKSATVDCSNFHHAKKDQNHNLGECPPVIRWHNAIEAGKQAIKELESQEPFAWAEFDGEGGYHLMLYENNETYAEDWNKTNPNHIGWVEPIYKHPPQRTWVGLTLEQYVAINSSCVTVEEAISSTEKQIKENNT